MNNLVLFIVLPVAGVVLGWTIRWLYARFQLSASEQKAERLRQDAIREAEAQKKEILLNAKDELIRERNQQERENRERRAEVQRYEARVSHKEEALDQRAALYDKQDKEYVEKLAALQKREAVVQAQEEEYRRELERISGLTVQEAKELIIRNLENDARHDAQALLNKVEQESQLNAEKKGARHSCHHNSKNRHGNYKRHYGRHCFPSLGRDEGPNHRTRRPQHPCLGNLDRR